MKNYQHNRTGRGIFYLLYFIFVCILPSIALGGFDPNKTVSYRSDSVKIAVQVPIYSSDSVAKLVIPFSKYALDGTFIALNEINENGGIRGVPLEVIVVNLPDFPTAGQTLRDGLQPFNKSEVVAMANLLCEDTVNYLVPVLEERNMAIWNPLVASNTIRTNFNEMLMFTTSDVELEISVLIQNLVSYRSIRRIVLLTNVISDNDDELIQFTRGNVAFAKRKLLALGATVVGEIYLKIGANRTEILNHYEQVRGLISDGDALLCLGIPDDGIGVFLGFVLTFHPKTYYIASYAATNPVVDGIISRFPEGTANGRIISTTYFPLNSDKRFPSIVRFIDAYKRYAATPQGKEYLYNSYDDGMSHPQATLAPLSYAALHTLATALQQAKFPLSPQRLKDVVFKGLYLEFEEFRLGIYSNATCEPYAPDACKCNSGAKRAYALSYHDNRSTYGLPRDEEVFLRPGQCRGSELELYAPFIKVHNYPEDVPDIKEAILVGHNAALGHFEPRSVIGLATSRVSKLLLRPLKPTTDITTDIQGLNYTMHRVLTSVLFAPLLSVSELPVPPEELLSNTSTGVLAKQTLLLEPLRHNTSAPGIRPAGSYAATVSMFRHVMYLLPTLEQALFTAATTLPTLGMNSATLVVPTSYEAVETAKEALVLALNTYGLTDVSVEHGVGSFLQKGKAQMAFVIGLTTGDVEALLSYLQRNAKGVVVIPYQDMMTVYGPLRAALGALAGDELRGVAARLLVASSLPMWNATIGNSSIVNKATRVSKNKEVLSAYNGNVTREKRHPAAMVGFIGEALVGSVASQVLHITGTELLETLYKLRVVSVAPGLLFGPYIAATNCSEDGARSECGNAAGASTTVLQPFAVASGLIAEDDVPAKDREVLEGAVVSMNADGSIDYRALPEDKSSDVIVVAVIVGVILLLLVSAAYITFICIMRKKQKRFSRYAPKDPSKPFTIAFTDIQKSTTLWAVAPDAMAQAIDTHHALIRELLVAHRGYEVKTIGDAFMIAFQNASDAVEFAVETQKRLLSTDWGPDFSTINAVYDTVQVAECDAVTQSTEQADIHSLPSMGRVISSRSAGQQFGRVVSYTKDHKAYVISLEEKDLHSHAVSEQYSFCETPRVVTPRIVTTEHPNDATVSSPELWKGLRVRIGMNTGLGEVRKDETTGGYDYYGDVVNTASRVETFALGGEVVITSSTLADIKSSDYQLLQEYDHFEVSKSALMSSGGVPLISEIKMQLPVLSNPELSPGSSAQLFANQTKEETRGTAVHYLTPLGKVLLRNVPEAVALYRVEAIQGRHFIHALRKKDALENGEGDSQDGQSGPSGKKGHSDSVDSEQTAISLPCEGPLKFGDVPLYAAAFSKYAIKALFATIPPRDRKKSLEGLIKHWGLTVRLAGTSNSYVLAASEALARRIAPIASKLVQSEMANIGKDQVGTVGVIRICEQQQQNSTEDRYSYAQNASKVSVPAEARYNESATSSPYIIPDTLTKDKENN